MGMLPVLPLELLCRQLADNVAAARPSLAARLAEHAGAVFAIDPTDCPFAFVLTVRHGRPSIAVRRDLHGIPCAARIAAPLLVLLGLIDGSYDGDALFFSRDLVIEGDTAAVLALRNALDDAEFDPATVAGVPVPMRDAFNRGAEVLLDRLRRLLDAPPASRPAAP